MTNATYPELKKKMANWEITHLSLRDGAQLRYGVWKPAAPAQGHVLLVPGRTEFIEKYTEEAGEWAQRGYQAYCFDLRGQGGSTRQVPQASHIDSFETYVRDLREFWDKVWLPNLNGKPGIVEAHSTGAQIALRLLASLPPSPAAQALIVTAPMVDMNTSHIPKPLTPAMAGRIINAMGRLRPTSYALGQGPHQRDAFAGNPHTRDERRHQEWQDMQDDLVHLTNGGPTWGWVRAAKRARHDLLTALPALKVPTLVLATPDDRVVDARAQYLIPATRRLDFPGEGHELLRAPDAVRAQLWAAKDSFISDIRQGGQDFTPKLRAPGP